MKKITLLLAFLCCSAMHSQGYQFSVTTATYQDLNAPVSISNGEIWDEPDYMVPIGFDFHLGSSTIHNLYFSVGSGGILTSNESFDEVISAFIPVAQDLADRGTASSQSPISYQLDGAPGQQILKIEWKNAGFWSDGTSNDYINFQLWLYESSNIVEYRYGPNSITNPDSFDGENGILTAFLPAVVLTTEQFLEPGYYLTGNPANPTAEVIDGSTPPTGSLNGAIPDGTVYRFTPVGQISISDFEKLDFKIHPNPSEDYIVISNANSNEIKVEIYNSLGQKLKSFNSVEGQELKVSDLSPGIYIIEVTSQGAKGTSKFIKR